MEYLVVSIMMYFQGVVGLLISMFIIMLLLLNTPKKILHLEEGLMMDYSSEWMILLSVWLFMLIFMKMLSYQLVSNNEFNLMYMMMLILFMAFSVKSLLVFFIMFELVLIPIFLIIVGWGYQPERLQAGVFMIMYTMVFSLIMMLGILNIYFQEGTFCMLMLGVVKSEMNFLSVMMILSMLVKFPVYFLHSWLPKAHVQAPSYGSMVLAGLLLKLGGYGMIRLCNFFIFKQMWLLCMITLGGLYSAVVSIRQKDMKSMVAYSSISHMMFVAVGLMSGKMEGLKGAVVLMVAHGLCSSGLFMMMDSIYSTMKTRMFILSKSLGFSSSLMVMWLFFMCVSNMSAPPTINLYSEVFLLFSGFNYSFNIVLIMVLVCFLCAYFSLFLFINPSHGWSVFPHEDVSSFMSMIYFMHWSPLNLMIMSEMI
uniref:NADH-ubiquinone oxidoreductase chain 4 n=1 Tax=Paratemnoides elongatus TaxID=51805 RepID=H9MFH7_9ARAC|nr:NADH dehydrogenase subunit 4 [Paratemnoides elongatus]AEX37722.1 NADH dehydrogenase subunit 4 [Paratemnoides elongatus]